ncbi:hypothetical protein D3C85_1862610 [compost metagenome]
MALLLIFQSGTTENDVEKLIPYWAFEARFCLVVVATPAASMVTMLSMELLVFLPNAEMFRNRSEFVCNA